VKWKPRYQLLFFAFFLQQINLERDASYFYLTFSVADPGCLKYFLPKNLSLSYQKYGFGKKPLPDPESRVKKAPDPDPQHC
jgi:hypothetical protein